MLNIRVVMALGSLVHSVSSTVRQANFEKMSEEDLTYSDYLLFSSPARSKLSCLELCTLTDCCVRFTHTLGRCRGHSTPVLPSDPGTHTPGAKTYVQAGVREISGMPSNVALNKVATQSSIVSINDASRAVDGNPDPNLISARSCSETQPLQLNWWQVDLGDGVHGYGYDVISVNITNRGDCCSERLRDFDVHVYTEDPETNPTATGTLCWHYDGQAGDGETEELVCCDGPIRGRFVRMTNAPGFSLTLCEVQVMAVPAV